MPNLSTQLKGFDKLEVALKKLGIKAPKVARKAVRSGAGVFRTAMRRKAPRGNQEQQVYRQERLGLVSKPLRDRIKVTTSKRPRTKNSVWARAVSQSPASLFIEFGTALRITKSGANRGRIIMQPFIRPAFKENHKKAQDRMAKVLKRNLFK